MAENDTAVQAAPAPGDTRTFIVIDICGSKKSVERMAASLSDEITSAIVLVQELQGNKAARVQLHMTQVAPVGKLV